MIKKRAVEIAVAEYGRILNSIPFGSEWEITLTGEERSWSDQANDRFDDRIVADAKTRLQIPSVKRSICEIIKDMEIFGLDPGGEFAALNLAEQEEAVRNSVLMSMYPRIQDIRFSGSAEWTSERSFWRSSKGDVWIECDACPRVVKRIGFTEPVDIYVNGFSFPAMGLGYPGDEVVGADAPKRTCVRTFRDGFSDRSEEYCPGTAGATTPTIPVLGGYWDLELFEFREGTVRVKEYRSHGPTFMSHYVDMTLCQVRPRDPAKLSQSAVNITRMTPSWSPDNTLSATEIADLRTRLIGETDGTRDGWTHPDIPPEKPIVEIEWLVNAIEDDPSLVCLSVDEIDLTQKLSVSMYIANKYRPGTCPYEAILRHEMKHADGYTSATDAYLDAARKALLESPTIPWNTQPLSVPASAVSQEQERIAKVVHDIIWPLFIRLLEIFQEQRAVLDTPTEYAQVRASCPDSDWE